MYNKERSPYVQPGLIRKVNPFLTEKMVFDLVLKELDITKEDLVSKCRKRELVDARKLLSYILKNKFRKKLKYIGKELGGRDHTTIVHSIKEFVSLYQTNYDFKSKCENIIHEVGLTVTN